MLPLINISFSFSVAMQLFVVTSMTLLQCLFLFSQTTRVAIIIFMLTSVYGNYLLCNGKSMYYR